MIQHLAVLTLSPRLAYQEACPSPVSLAKCSLASAVAHTLSATQKPCLLLSTYLRVLRVFTVVEEVSSANDVHVGVLQLGQAQGLEVVNLVNEA